MMKLFNLTLEKRRELYKKYVVRMCVCRYASRDNYYDILSSLFIRMATYAK